MSAADTPEPSPLPPGLALPEHYEPPRLSILHLLIWMTVAAVLFKLQAWHEATEPGYDISAHSLLIKADFTANIILDAAAYVGMGVLAISMFRGLRGRLQPGHWILAGEVPPHVCIEIAYVARGVVFLFNGPRRRQ